MKYSKKYILYSFLLSLPTVVLVILACLMIFTTTDETTEETLFNGILGVNDYYTLGIAMGISSAIYIVLLVAYLVILWNMTTYSISESNIVFKSGVFFRKNIVLSYDKVHAITIDRPLALRFFGLSKLAIDSGNTVKNNNEIVIIDNEKAIKELEKELHLRLQGGIYQQEDEVLAENSPYSYKMDLRLAARFVFNNVWLYIILLVSLAIAAVVTVVSDDPLAAISFAALPLGSFLVFSVAAIVSMMVTYYNYKVVETADEVVVSFGLFDIKRIVIAKSRVKAVIVNQDIVQKATGYASVELEMVGLKSNDNEHEVRINHLVPFVKLEDVQNIIAVFSNDFALHKSDIKAKKDSLIFFMLLPMLIVSLIAMPFVIGYSIRSGILDNVSIILICTYALLILVIAICSIFKKQHQGISYDDKNLYLTNGILTKKYHIIPWKNVISVGSVTTPLRKKYGVASLVVSTYTNKLETQKTVSMLSTDDANKIFQIFNKK